MSVPVSERKASHMEFLKTAHKIRNCAIRRARKLPKSWDRYIGDPLVAHAGELVAHVRYANSIYPTNQLELDERILQLKFAIGSCEILSGK